MSTARIVSRLLLNDISGEVSVEYLTDLAGRAIDVVCAYCNIDHEDYPAIADPIDTGTIIICEGMLAKHGVEGTTSATLPWGVQLTFADIDQNAKNVLNRYRRLWA